MLKAALRLLFYFALLTSQISAVAQRSQVEPTALRVPLIYNGGVIENRLSLNRFVELTSTAAAKMFGLFPKKGTIAVGSDADLVIFDGDKEQTLSVKTQHMNCDYNAYEGKKIKGVVETVLSRGKVVVDQGDFKGKPGDGKFLKRGTCVAM